MPFASQDNQKSDWILVSPKVFIHNGYQVIGISDKTNNVRVVVEEVVCPSASKNQQVILHLIGVDYLDVQRAGIILGMSRNRHLFK